MADLIDRQAAIKAIEDLQDCYNGFSDTYDKACIIGVLEEVPSVQPDEDVKFWKDRSEYYCKMVGDLMAEMGRGVKLDSIQWDVNSGKENR